MTETDTTALRILPRNTTADLIGVNLRTLERLVSAGDFPRPVRISRNRQGFLASDVLRWVADRERA